MWIFINCLTAHSLCWRFFHFRTENKKKKMNRKIKKKSFEIAIEMHSRYHILFLSTVTTINCGDFVISVNGTSILNSWKFIRFSLGSLIICLYHQNVRIFWIPYELKKIKWIKMFWPRVYCNNFKSNSHLNEANEEIPILYIFISFFSVWFYPNGIISDLPQCACNQPQQRRQRQLFRNVNQLNSIVRCDWFLIFFFSSNFCIRSFKICLVLPSTWCPTLYSILRSLSRERESSLLLCLSN